MSLLLELKRINKWRQNECVQCSAKKPKPSICSVFNHPLFLHSLSPICLINRISVWPVGGIRVRRTANLMVISENVGFFFSQITLKVHFLFPLLIHHNNHLTLCCDTLFSRLHQTNTSTTLKYHTHVYFVSILNCTEVLGGNWHVFPHVCLCLFDS